MAAHRHDHCDEEEEGRGAAKALLDRALEEARELRIRLAEAEGRLAEVRSDRGHLRCQLASTRAALAIAVCRAAPVLEGGADPDARASTVAITLGGQEWTFVESVHIAGLGLDEEELKAWDFPKPKPKPKAGPTPATP